MDLQTWKNEVASINCVCCLFDGLVARKAELHHAKIENEVSMGARESDLYIIPLCPGHHRLGSSSRSGGYSFISRHGNPLLFESMYGTDRALLSVTRAILDNKGIDTSTMGLDPSYYETEYNNHPITRWLFA